MAQENRRKDGTATHKLHELQHELTAVEAEIAAAEDAADVDALTASRARRVTLQSLVDKLELQVAAEAESAGVQMAQAWLSDTYPKSMAQWGPKVAAAKARARKHIEAAKAAIAEEAELRREPHRLRVAAQVVGTRFALAVPDVDAEVPYVEDWAGPIIGAAARLVPRGSSNRFRVPGVPVSATPQQRRMAALRAVNEWVTRYGAALPDDVRVMLSTAPIADGAIHEPPRELTPRERRLGQRASAVGAEVATMRRGYNALRDRGTGLR